MESVPELQAARTTDGVKKKSKAEKRRQKKYSSLVDFLN
jgi:hypothetical protein